MSDGRLRRVMSVAGVAGALLMGLYGRARGQGGITLAQPLAETAWISQVVWEEEVEGAAGLSVGVRGVDLDPAVAAHAEWEIRTADETKRAARFSVPWVMEGKGRETSTEGAGFKVPAREVRRMVALEPGEYVMAWLLDGERRSNVVKFRVMKAGEQRAAGEYLRVVQGEPRREGELPTAEVRVLRRTAADPGQSNVEWAVLEIDGKLLERKQAPAFFIRPELRVGETVGAPVYWEQMKVAVNGSKPHTIKAKFAGQESKETALLTTTPLGDAWDAATAKLAPAPKAAVQVEGRVTDASGAAGAGYSVALVGGAQNYEEVSDGAGRYSFAGVPAGEYELTCVPGGKKAPLAVVSKVVVGSGRAHVDVTFEGKFAVSGKVEKPADDEGPAGPAAGRMVRATFVSADGGTEVNTYGATGADGTYAVKGPYEKVSFVGVMSSPEPTPVKGIVAPKSGLDFELVGEAEERRRVR